MIRPGRQEYWLHKEAKDVVGHLEQYHTKWSVWDNSPFRQAWVRNIIAYYSPVLAPANFDTSLVFEGVQGELVRLYTPKARVLVREKLGIVTKQKLAAQGIADSTSPEVIRSLKIANALLPQMITDQRLHGKGKQSLEGALVAGIWFGKACWRTDKGEPYTQGNNGTVIYTGGVEVSVHSPFDVCYDVSYCDWREVPWVEVRVVRNRWDLIAQHPDLEREIKSLPSLNEVRGPNVWFDRSEVNEDSVYCYELFVRPSPSMPKGRLLIYGDNRCVFHDDFNKYGDIPVEPLVPEPVMLSGLGYPQLSNILPSQEMMDNSISAIATNQAQNAVQSIAIPRGSGINVQEIMGMRFVSFTPQNVPGGGLPTPLQLSQTAPETFKFADFLDNKMSDMWGMAGALRGTPPPGVTSGTAIATLTANALESNEPLSEAYNSFLERILYHAIRAHVLFGQLPQQVRLEGRNNQVSYDSFEGPELDSIKGVHIVTSNPLMQTISGRIEVAEKLLQMPKEYWPKYTAILEGRPLSDLYKNDLSEDDLIHAENEALMRGEPVPALMTDCHPLHVQDHRGLLNDPNIRANGQYIQAVLNHIQEHMMLARQEDPLLRAFIETGRMPDMTLGAPPEAGAASSPPPGLPGAATNQAAQPAEDILKRGIEAPQQQPGAA